MGKTKLAANSSLIVQLTSPQTDEFYLADITVVQYQCSKNCLDCSFSLAQSSSCKACLPFYRTDTNCLTCANGFFEAVNGSRNRCVKCYANCKQCMGASNFHCLECFSNFEIKDLAFNTPCINQVVTNYRSKTEYLPSPGRCPSPPSLQELASKSNCLACLSASQAIYSDPNCISCWLGLGYAWGRCEPKLSSGLTFYASDIVLNSSSTAWSAEGLIQQGCTSDYPGIVGVPNIPNNAHHSPAVPTTLTYTLTSLPNHFGLTFHLNLFKIDYWSTDPANKSPNPLNLTIFVDSPNAASSQFILPLSNSVGANICH